MHSYTFFAPSERASTEVIKKQRLVVQSQPLFRKLLDTIPIWVLVLNEERQLIMANQFMLNAIRRDCDDDIVGLRLGEVLSCIHADEGPGGCGTSEHCQTCGAVTAFLVDQKDGKDEKECRISVRMDTHLKSLDLRVRSITIEISEYIFHAFYLSDISHEKRRRSLERIFFHDLLNTAGGLKGITEMLKMEVYGESRELAETLHDVSSRLIHEIESQKQLLAAESGDLRIEPMAIGTYNLGQSIIIRFSKQDVAIGKTLHLCGDYSNVELVTDPWLLERVISNLVKNALEASQVGQKITLGCRANETGVSFFVHNESVMDRTIQLQIFQRSFSTKGPDRGLGTYSVKLLTETYLNGDVFFESSEEKGTTFTLICPWVLTNA